MHGLTNLRALWSANKFDNIAMRGHCVDWVRKQTKSESCCINASTKRCNECAPTKESVEEIATIYSDAILSELSVKDFTIWFKSELDLDSLIQKKMEIATKDLKIEVEGLKENVKTAKEEITKLRTKVDNLSKL